MVRINLSTTTHLHCLQVWGGTEAAQQTLQMTGLDGYLYAKPHQGAKRGGDVYYVSSCASGQITRVLLADVSGHGTKAAETAQDLRALMQQYVNFTHQQKFMSEMNRSFARIAEGGRFATTVVMSYLAPKQLLSLSNAGHPAPLWYQAKKKTWTVLGLDPSDENSAAAAGLPLGIVDDAGYEQMDITFAPGDLLLMYTDALIESRDADGKLLGIRGLVNRLNAMTVGDPADLVPTLVDELTQQDAHDLTDDDVTVLLIAANKRRAGLVKTVFAPLTLMRGKLRGIPAGGAH